MATVPYLTEDQVRKYYADQGAAYEKQRRAEADRYINSTNQQYDNSQRGNYVNYRMNQRDLPEQLARQGITGGASETSALRAQTNYENNYLANEAQRNSKIKDINDAYSDAMATYRMTANQAMNDEIKHQRELRANYEKQLQQEAEQRFANTISGYDNIATIDKLMDSIRKSGKDLWKIDYLRARRAELVAAQKAMASSGGGGGGYGGYSYRSGGGRSGSSNVNSSGSGKIGGNATAKGSAMTGGTIGQHATERTKKAPKSFGRNAYLRSYR